jgi:hypothetical protein
MKTVADLIKELQQYPPDAYAAAYSAEETGIVIYPATFASYSMWDFKSNEADKSSGFIELCYDDLKEKRPKGDSNG